MSTPSVPRTIRTADLSELRDLLRQDDTIEIEQGPESPMSQMSGLSGSGYSRIPGLDLITIEQFEEEYNAKNPGRNNENHSAKKQKLYDLP